MSVGDEAEEGAVLTRLHRFRERDRGIVDRRKSRALKEHGTLACEECGFDFRKTYGLRGDGYIECHHAQRVSALKPAEKDEGERPCPPLCQLPSNGSRLPPLAESGAAEGDRPSFRSPVRAKVHLERCNW